MTDTTARQPQHGDHITIDDGATYRIDGDVTYQPGYGWVCAAAAGNGARVLLFLPEQHRAWRWTS